MGFFKRVLAWFKPKPKGPFVLSDEMLTLVPNDVLMQAVLHRTMVTGQPVSIRRPHLEPLRGESPEQTHERTERELNAMADLLGVQRQKVSTGN